jgi:hypothetical protein
MRESGAGLYAFAVLLSWLVVSVVLTIGMRESIMRAGLRQAIEAVSTCGGDMECEQAWVRLEQAAGM